jgi:drug/metabolite transporter (DMT)-like permease
MLRVTVDHATRNIAVGILTAMLAVLVAILSYVFRRNRRLSPLPVIGVYYALLMVLFIGGSLLDDGYGMAFVPLMIATVPSSFLVPILAQWPVIHWFEGYLGNFVLIVVLCGGLNSLAFYLIAKLVGGAHRQHAKATATTPDPRL